MRIEAPEEDRGAVGAHGGGQDAGRGELGHGVGRRVDAEQGADLVAVAVVAERADVHLAADHHRAVQRAGVERRARVRDRHRRNRARRHVEPAGAVGVGDPHRRAFDRDAAQVAEPRRRAGAVARARHARGARDGRHRARGDGEPADRLVAAVGDPEVPARQRDPEGLVEPGGAADAVAATRGSRATCDRRDHPGRDDDLADRVVAGVGDVEVRAVGDEALEVVEPRRSARAVGRAGEGAHPIGGAQVRGGEVDPVDRVAVGDVEDPADRHDVARLVVGDRDRPC